MSLDDKEMFARFIGRDEYSARHAALIELIRSTSAAFERAHATDEVSIEKRFAAVNEFRQTLADQTKTFVTRAESDLAISAAYERIGALSTAVAGLSSRLDLAEGRRIGTTNGLGYLVGIGGLLLVILQHFWK